MVRTRPVKRIIFHGIGDARAAARAAAALGVELRLVSAPGAAAYAGPAWFREVTTLIRAEFPGLALDAVLDCGDAPGYALAALRAGVTAIRLDAPARVRARVAAIAARTGGRLDAERQATLDLAGADHPEAACRAWLADGG